MLVCGSDDEGPIETRLLDVQLARHTDTRGRVHLSALSNMAIYPPPKSSTTPENADARCDVFSLGALAWFVFVERTPALATFRDREGGAHRSELHAVTTALIGRVAGRRGAARARR